MTIYVKEIHSKYWISSCKNIHRRCSWEKLDLWTLYIIPNWASSCSSRWLNASQGQITVMSARDGRISQPSPHPEEEPLLQEEKTPSKQLHTPLHSWEGVWDGPIARKDAHTCTHTHTWVLGSFCTFFREEMEAYCISQKLSHEEEHRVELSSGQGLKWEVGLF